jgi:hypothetical protein
MSAIQGYLFGDLGSLSPGGGTRVVSARLDTPSDPSHDKGLSRQVTSDGTAGEAFYVTPRGTD